MIKNPARRQEDTPSSYVPRYTREHRKKLHHPIWKPSLGTFIDPDLWWHPGCRESCIKPRELEDMTIPTGPGLLRGKSKSSGNPRDLDLSPLTLTIFRNQVLRQIQPFTAGRCSCLPNFGLSAVTARQGHHPAVQPAAGGLRECQDGPEQQLQPICEFLSCDRECHLIDVVDIPHLSSVSPRK